MLCAITSFSPRMYSDPGAGQHFNYLHPKHTKVWVTVTHPRGCFGVEQDLL